MYVVYILTGGVERFAYALGRDVVHFLQHHRQHGVEQQRASGDHHAVDRPRFEHSVRVFEGQQTAGRPGVDGVAGT